MLPRRAFLSLWVLCAAGCAGLDPPPFLHPGTEELQQARAQRFDPYPVTDVGPSVDGGRPKDYDRPPPENERVQNDLSFQGRYGQPAPPGLYKPTRSISSRAIRYTPGPPIIGSPTLPPPTLETAPAFVPP